MISLAFPNNINEMGESNADPFSDFGERNVTHLGKGVQGSSFQRVTYVSPNCFCSHCDGDRLWEKVL